MPPYTTPQPQQPISMPPEPQGPPQSFMPHQPMQPQKNNKALLIAIITAVVLLLAAGVVAWWMLAQKNSGTTAGNAVQSQAATADTINVTKVAWVAPAIPAAYTTKDQSTPERSAQFYVDAANECSLITSIAPMPAGKTIKDEIMSAAQAAEASGIKIASSAQGDKYTITDTDGKHSYQFASLLMTQSVDVKGVDFTKQDNLIAYQQFGSQLVSIGMACKDQTWTAQKPVLEGLLKQFKVTTQR